jgi:hypothetical protein
VLHAVLIGKAGHPRSAYWQSGAHLQRQHQKFTFFYSPRFTYKQNKNCSANGIGAA